MSGQIFISYRREESQWSARSLYDRGRTAVTWVPIITVDAGRHWRLRGITCSVWRFDQTAFQKD